MAFAVEGYLSRELKDDPKYVKYLARSFGIKNGVEFERILPFHKCTEDDWDMFPPPSKSFKDVMTLIKTDPERGMFCIDPTEELHIYGNEKSYNYQRLELIITPCNYLHTHLGYEGDSIHPECIADLDKQKEYLGPIDLMLYFSEDYLSARSFDDDLKS